MLGDGHHPQRFGLLRSRREPAENIGRTGDAERASTAVVSTAEWNESTYLALEINPYYVVQKSHKSVLN